MDVKEFLPELRRLVQGPLQAVMADELYSSAISFCKESQAIREEFQAGDVVESQVYELTPTTQGVKVWGVALVHDGVDELKRDVDYKSTSRSTIKFLRNLNGVTIVAWLCPIDRTNLPDALADYDTAIACGAASSIQVQLDKPWTNGSLASVNQRQFVEGYRKAWREVVEQYGNFQNPTVNNSYWV